MSIASRIAGQRRAGGRSVRQTSRGGTTYVADSGSTRTITPTPSVVAKIQAEEVSQETFVDPGKSGGGGRVKAGEYIKHHAETYGTSQDVNLGLALDNLYSDEQAVIPISEGVTVVINQSTNEADVIHDNPLTDSEKANIRGIIDKAGDVPNTTIFVEGGYGGGGYSEAAETGEGGEIAPGSRSSGSFGALSKGAMVAIAGIAIVLWFMVGGKK